MVSTLIVVLVVDAIWPGGSGFEIVGGVLSATVKVWLGDGELVCDDASVHLTWTECEAAESVPMFMVTPSDGEL